MRVEFPMRLKIMMSLLVALTLVVIVITFVMANFFHDDKQSYMNDWVSIAAISTAEEARSELEVYAERIQRYAGILELEAEWEEKEGLLRGLFESFPELLHITLVEDGAPGEPVVESRTLADAGLTAEDIARFREEHPIPLDRVASGRPFVRNSTIDPDLPTLTLAVATTITESTDGIVVAEIRLDRLMQIGANFRVFEILLVASDGTLLAHPESDRVSGRRRADLVAEAWTVEQENRAGMTLEFTRDDTEFIGGYSGVGFGGAIVGTQMPKSAAYLASRDLLSRLTIVAVVLLIGVGIGGRLWARRIVRPVERLSSATRSIAKGNFDIQVDVRSRDEIGSLAGSFNAMAHELKAREVELETAHQQLIQSEKMSAFGQIGAGIAHEVKNPLAGILGCAQLSLLDLPEDSLVRTNLEIIEKETARCKKIIENLMRFARSEGTELEPTDLNDVVRDAVAIVNHQLEMNQVRISVDLSSDVPLIDGNANQLQQVLMNLMINAQQAFSGEKGSVSVETRRLVDDQVQIVVSDTGPGIPPDIQDRLFDPFFTTKPTGHGTGLGLSVSYGIIQEHKGTIEVESTMGAGATFVVTLPSLRVDYVEEPLRQALEEVHLITR